MKAHVILMNSGEVFAMVFEVDDTSLENVLA